MAVLDYDGNILGIGGGIGEKKVRSGLQPRNLSPPDRFYDEAHRCLYALALDYKLISYSSPQMDIPYYTAEDKKCLEG